MATPSAYARDATATLNQVLHLGAEDFDAERTAAVIEDAIRKATRERGAKARRQLKESQTSAERRLAQLLSSSPAVIYSFKARDDYAPIFVSGNIERLLGYSPGIPEERGLLAGAGAP